MMPVHEPEYRGARDVLAAGGPPSIGIGILKDAQCNTLCQWFRDDGENIRGKNEDSLISF